MALLLGAIVGIERERIQRGAGLKTHVLVSVGSALFTHVSRQGFLVDGHTNDPARLAAQIVSGIGFLGAGTIMKQGSTIRGLTTAASLWVVAGIGTACGCGLYGAALAATTLVMLSLPGLKLIERSMSRNEVIHLAVHAPNTPGRLEQVRDILGQMGMRSTSVRVTTTARRIRMRLRVDVPWGGFDHAGLVQRLNETGAHHVEWRLVR